jgi:hypothetical protein
MGDVKSVCVEESVCERKEGMRQVAVYISIASTSAVAGGVEGSEGVR